MVFGTKFALIKTEMLHLWARLRCITKWESRISVFDVNCSVASGKKNIFVLFLTIAFGGALLICSGQSSVVTADTDESVIDAGKNDNSGSETFSSFSGDPNFSNPVNNRLGTNELFYRAIFAVVVVIVLAVAAVYVSKKLLPKITKIPGREIHVVETIYIGQRKALHLVEAGNRRLLIGSTNENITKLADITDEVTFETQKFMDNNRGLDN
jgi:flagellar biosynthetic protein FliO